MNPPNRVETSDEQRRLSALLDEWQLGPEVEISAEFERGLQARIASAPSGGRGWVERWREVRESWAPWQASLVGAVALVAAVVGLGVYYHGGRDAVPMERPAQAAIVDPLVRDLQALNANSDQLDSLAVLNGGGAGAGTDANEN